MQIQTQRLRRWFSWLQSPIKHRLPITQDDIITSSRLSMRQRGDGSSRTGFFLSRRTDTTWLTSRSGCLSIELVHYHPPLGYGLFLSHPPNNWAESHGIRGHTIFSAFQPSPPPPSNLYIIYTCCLATSYPAVDFSPKSASWQTILLVCASYHISPIHLRRN